MQNPVIVRGCNCLRSRCLKCYCECFAAARACLNICCCKDCENVYGIRPVSSNAARAHPATLDLSGADDAPPLKVDPFPKPSPRNPCPALHQQPPETSRADSQDTSAGQRGAAATATQLPAKRRGLDNLFAAVDAVEGDTHAQKPRLWQPLSPTWDHLLPFKPSDTTTTSARRVHQAAQPVHCLRRAATAEEAAMAPRTCYLLPAGTPLDNRAQYTVREYDVTAEMLLGGTNALAAAKDASVLAAHRACRPAMPSGRPTSNGARADGGSADGSEDVSMSNAIGTDGQLRILGLDLPATASARQPDGAEQESNGQVWPYIRMSAKTSAARHWHAATQLHCLAWTVTNATCAE